jgi:superfamily I DNA/RNA helicase
MPITTEQIKKAEEEQHIAAHATQDTIRLIAGPGSGKSYSIQERVRWLLENKVLPNKIFVISFTRASTIDLHNRILAYCDKKGLDNANLVNVSTLHSLALKSLRRASLLNFPADPLVLENFEQEEILDSEFSIFSGLTSGRCKLIRRNYEAFCSTEKWDPPNYILPDLPITDEERIKYKKFHDPRSQLYSCVLPGELVRECVINMRSNLLDPVSLLDIKYLIVDEYQDLNPVDLEFIDRLINSGVNTFVAGDDDQSIYSFRFASPHGIQSFLEKYPKSSDFELSECFRCSSDILQLGQIIMENFSESKRIPKKLKSLYLESEPPVKGAIHRWCFPSFIKEISTIAESCSRLIQSGISPKNIMILINNKREVLPYLIKELEKFKINFDAPKTTGFLESNPGKFLIACLRLINNTNDYVSLRLLLGLQPGIGTKTCNSIADLAISNSLNYRELFINPLPSGVFNKREIEALEKTKSIVNILSTWSKDDALKNRINELIEIFIALFGENDISIFKEAIEMLPPETTLEELCNFLRADTDEQQDNLLKNIYSRLGLTIPDDGLSSEKVRIMTMHGAKGLSSEIVFIPGLMEELFPGSFRQPYPGLILEAARILYVSITRARAACVFSYSKTRVVYGTFSRQSPSRFAKYLNGPFVNRTEGLTEEEVEEIKGTVNNLY